MTKKTVICSDCGFIGSPKKQIRGSALIERLLWVTLFFPGILYGIWRKRGRVALCPRCGSDFLVDFDTEEGQRIMERHLKTTTKPTNKGPR